MERNMDIVTLTSMLLAMPGGPEKVRSGTWSTIRAATKMGRPVIVFPPDGEAYTIGFEAHTHDE
jgi:predicted Rossmann fold nucleotide-binding protein DprA/Smf involved in DNA uptake